MILLEVNFVAGLVGYANARLVNPSGHYVLSCHDGVVSCLRCCLLPLVEVNGFVAALLCDLGREGEVCGPERIVVLANLERSQVVPILDGVSV